MKYIFLSLFLCATVSCELSLDCKPKEGCSLEVICQPGVSDEYPILCQKKSPSPAESALCPVVFANKCFFPVIGTLANVDEGARMCQSLGGHLANIYSQAHMVDLMNYIREHRMHSLEVNFIQYRLGMTFNTTTNKLQLRNGANADDSLKWNPHSPLIGPYDVDRTSVLLSTMDDPCSPDQYLFNDLPVHQYHFVCEMP